MGVADEILATAKRPREVIKVEGEPWGRDDIFVLKMSGVERDQYQQEIIDRCDKTGAMKKVVGWRAKVVTTLTCDQYGVKLFKPEQAGVLNETDPDAIDLVFETIREVNGLRPNDEEELRGNSEGEAGTGSSAASPSGLESLQESCFLDGSPVKT